MLSANWNYWLLFSSSTTFLAHLFGKIDSFLLFCSSRACATTEGRKTARKNQFCQKNVREKLLKDDPTLADSTFCKTTDVIFRQCHVKKAYIKAMGPFLTTLLAHLFGKCFFAVLLPSVTAQGAARVKHQRIKLPNKCVRKVIKELSKSKPIYYSDWKF